MDKHIYRYLHIYVTNGDKHLTMKTEPWILIKIRFRSVLEKVKQCNNENIGERKKKIKKKNI